MLEWVEVMFTHTRLKGKPGSKVPAAQGRSVSPGCSGLMHWDDPEGGDGEGGGRGVQDGEQMNTHG